MLDLQGAGVVGAPVPLVKQTSYEFAPSDSSPMLREQPRTLEPDEAHAILIGKVRQLLERDHPNAQLSAVLLAQRLGVIRTIKWLALGVYAGVGVFAPDNQVVSTIISPDQGMP
jgi:hypothetical protein